MAKPWMCRSGRLHVDVIIKINQQINQSLQDENRTVRREAIILGYVLLLPHPGICCTWTPCTKNLCRHTRCRELALPPQTLRSFTPLSSCHFTCTTFFLISRFLSYRVLLVLLSVKFQPCPRPRLQAATTCASINRTEATRQPRSPMCRQRDESAPLLVVGPESSCGRHRGFRLKVPTISDNASLGT